MFETDPRIQFRNHRERGPKARVFTLNDIARLSGLKLSTVRSSGRIDSLEVAMVVVTRSWARSARAATATDFLANGWHEDNVPKWADRWPLIQAWVCPLCPALTLARGACEAHGGARPAVRFGAIGHFEVEHEKGYMPLHRLIMGSPKGLDVHHVDFNRWNNRRENLVAITREEHRRIHFPGRSAPREGL